MSIKAKGTVPIAVKEMELRQQNSNTSILIEEYNVAIANGDKKCADELFMKINGWDR